MSDDLVKRLRSGVRPYDTITLAGVKHNPRCLEAAACIEALEAELQRARSEARHAMADAYRMGYEAQAAAIDAALAELDASLFANAEHQRAKDILRSAREATK